MNALANKADLRDLARFEATMHRTRNAAREFWEAALEIYDRELWRQAKPEDGEPYSSWADYLERRWPDIHRVFALRKLRVARALQALPGADAASDRALAVIAGQSPEVQEAVWEAATADGKAPTEAETRRLLAELSPAEQKERIEGHERKNKAKLRAEGDRARKRQAEALVNRLVKLAAGIPETADVAEVYLRAGLVAMVSADDPERFVPLQQLVEQVKEAMGEAA